MPKKKKNTGLVTCQLTINSIEIENYKYLNVSLNKDEIKLLILKEEGEVLSHIASTPQVSKDLYLGFLETETIEIIISSIFKQIKCPICNEESSALRFTKVLVLGNICQYCWQEHDPPIEWKTIDYLESYIAKEHKL